MKPVWESKSAAAAGRSPGYKTWRRGHKTAKISMVTTEEDDLLEENAWPISLPDIRN
ncbi:MAG: hypothetical protein PHY77_03110 [Desulfotomaculaceae bacterium]|nr:hypothetical protein [Desulfotomaculaceae bacterium]